jgi:hypothetical protein
MVTNLTVQQSFPVAPSEVFALLLDRNVVEECVRTIGGEGAAVLTHHYADGQLSIVTQSPVDPADVPAALRPMIGSNAKGTKTETWASTDGEHGADFQISVPGAPASVSARARLVSAANGALLTIEGSAEVKVPILGPKIERLLVDQVSARLTAEYEFMCSRLA